MSYHNVCSLRMLPAVLFDMVERVPRQIYIYIYRNVNFTFDCRILFYFILFFDSITTSSHKKNRLRELCQNGPPKASNLP